MQVEFWKKIPFAPKYLASSYGRIMGLRQKPLALMENHGGYLVVNLHKIQYRVNRVICLTFHGEPPTPEHHAAHKDSKRWNNKEGNLYWATPKQNADDLAATEANKSENHWRAMFTEDQIRYIRAEYAKGYSVADLAREFPEACYATISHIVHLRSYKDVR